MSPPRTIYPSSILRTRRAKSVTFVHVTLYVNCSHIICTRQRSRAGCLFSSIPHNSFLHGNGGIGGEGEIRFTVMLLAGFLFIYYYYFFFAFRTKLRNVRNVHSGPAPRANHLCEGRSLPWATRAHKHASTSL